MGKILSEKKREKRKILGRIKNQKKQIRRLK